MNLRQLDEEAIFHLARKIPEKRDRGTYLDQICAGDQALRERVEALLEVHEKEQSFLKSSQEPPTVDHTLVAERPGATIGRFKLMEQLGEGGMGTVFVGQQERPIRRKVAIKVIKPGMDSKAVVARFEAERQALAMMDHPNIAKVLDAGTTESGRPYFAMELVKGIPITEYCDKNKLTIRERLDLFIQVCQAIQHAHQKGIIHRDIKPSNVLVTLHDGKPVPKVIDFGVAKALNARLTDKTIYTEHLQIVGTLLYMSPEQAELSGLDIDTRSDVYSLGVLLYELLTGTTPFQKAELDEAGFDEQRRIIREQDPPRASNRISSLGETATTVAEHRHTDARKLQQLVRGDLDWIVAKALEKDRTRRYDTTVALGNDIARFLSNEPVEARPPSAVYKTHKFVSRNKRLVVGTLAFAIVLVAGIIGTSSALIWAIRASEVAKDEERRAHKFAGELQDAVTDLRGELFDRALIAVMNNDPNSAEWIERARIAGVSQDQLEILYGQHALYSGRPEDAIAHFERAIQYRDSVAATAMLAMAYNFTGRYEDWARVSYKLDELPLESPEDFLFKAQATVVVVDPDESMILVDQAIQMRRSPLAFAIRGEVGTWLAIHRSDLDSALTAVDDIRTARSIIGDRPYVLQVDLFAHMIALILAGESQNGVTLQLRKEADDAAAHLRERFADYATGRFHCAHYFDHVGDLASAENEWKEVRSLSGSTSFVMQRALTLYRRGKFNEAGETIEDMEMCLDKIYGLPALLKTTNGCEIARQVIDESVRRSRVDPTYRSDFVLRGLMYLGQGDRATSLAGEWLKMSTSSVPGAKLWPSWVDSKIRFIAGSESSEQLIEIAGRSRVLLCDAHCLIGTKHMSDGELVRAKDHFEKSVETDAVWFLAYMLSDGILKHGLATEESASEKSTSSDDST